MLGPGPPFAEASLVSLGSLLGVDQRRAKVCNNCGVTSTTQWRNVDDSLLCNKCGLYFNRYQRHRPQALDNPATPSVGKVSNVRRKQLELGLQHHARRQAEEARYHRALGAIGHLDLGQFPNVPQLQQMLDEFQAHQQQQQQQQYGAPLPPPTAAPLFYPGPEPGSALHAAMALEVQQHLDRAGEMLGHLQGQQASLSPSPCPTSSTVSEPTSSAGSLPHPLSSVLQRQLDIQLQHAPARQLTEIEWHRRAAAVSQLPPQAYLPYIGDAFPLAPPPWGPPCTPTLPVELEKPDLLRLMRAGLTGRAVQAFSSPLSSPPRPPSPQAQELEATARQSLARKHRPLFEGAAGPAPADPRRAPRKTRAPASPPACPNLEWTSGSMHPVLNALWMDVGLEGSSPRSSDSMFDSPPGMSSNGTNDCMPMEVYDPFLSWCSAEGGNMLLDLPEMESNLSQWCL